MDNHKTLDLDREEETIDSKAESNDVEIESTGKCYCGETNIPFPEINDMCMECFYVRSYDFYNFYNKREKPGNIVLVDINAEFACCFCETELSFKKNPPRLVKCYATNIGNKLPIACKTCKTNENSKTAKKNDNYGKPTECRHCGSTFNGSKIGQDNLCEHCFNAFTILKVWYLERNREFKCSSCSYPLNCDTVYFHNNLRKILCKKCFDEDKKNEEEKMKPSQKCSRKRCSNITKKDYCSDRCLALANGQMWIPDKWNNPNN